MTGARKDLRRVVRLACRHGLVFSQNGHGRLTDPNTGKFITFPSTPSDPNAHRHVLKALRDRLGVTLS